MMRIDEPRFVRLLEDPFGVEVVKRLKPLYLMLRNDNAAVTVAQGGDAVEALRRLLLDLPGLVGAGSVEEFLIGYHPVDYTRLAAPDVEVVATWQVVMGDLYRLGLSKCLMPGAIPDIEEVREVRDRLIELYKTRLDPLLHGRVAYWSQCGATSSRE